MRGAAPSVIPTLRYQDPAKAISWLCEAFGLTEAFVARTDDGSVAHAQLTYGTGMVMLGPASDGEDGRLAVPHGPAWIYVVVDDVDAHHERAVAAGAEIIQEPREEDYGGKGYAARDFEGNVWSFGGYRPEMS
ncbi:VOC family protein [Sphaerimonospora mesophila]|uniref:VOC family protein n=1 Tax=Sphaerimonospora mesophila TaxID=37483 RepID=UPI0006E1D103